MTNLRPGALTRLRQGALEAQPEGGTNVRPGRGSGTAQTAALLLLRWRPSAQSCLNQIRLAHEWQRELRRCLIFTC